MGKSILGEDMFPDMVRIYQNKNSSDKYQTTPYWEMIYEGRANIQEKDTGSETNDVDKSEYAAYLEDNDVTIPSGCLLDWQNFNHPFSDNSNSWREIKKPPFNTVTLTRGPHMSGLTWSATVDSLTSYHCHADAINHFLV